VYLSDIPRYDLSSDYILLAEQRQAEADLKDKFERLTLELQVRARRLCVRARVWLCVCGAVCVCAWRCVCSAARV
jgi:guanylate cyclase soluble subunit beta